MTTSLAEQLKRLSVPQSSIYKEDRKKVSLLFNPKDAAAKDRDTFYEIGLSGLNELITIYDGFASFRDSLFSISFKDFERAVESKEVNESLNRHIHKFLTQLAPYFLLQSSHKSLEWLINRFHIHEYNQDDILALILPYHETKIFVRFLQILNLKNVSNRWNWLAPLQKPGIPLSKQVLFNHCASNMSFIRFLGKHLARTVEEFGTRAHLLTTLYGFFCSAIIGAIETVSIVTEGLISALLPVLLNALDSQINDYKSLSYMVFGYLLTKVQLKRETLNDIVTHLFNSDLDMSYNVTLLLNLVYKTQDSITEIPDEILYDLSAQSMQNLCVNINQLIEKNINVKPFVLAFLRTILPVIQSDISEFERFSNLPEILIDEVDFKTQDPDEIILCVFNCYKHKRSCESDDKGSSESTDGSDIEIVEEGNGIKANPLTLWYSSLLKSLEQKYPVAFDNLLKSGINGNGRLSEEKCSNLRAVISFVPGIVHKLGDTHLFESLHHVNPQMRMQAVRYMGKHSSKMISNNSEFVKDSVINRLNDDNPEVVIETLKIINKNIINVIGKDELLPILTMIINKGHKKGWSQVGNASIALFSSLKLTDVTQDILYAIFPYLFPEDDQSAQLAMSIMESHWGKSFPLTALSAKVLKSSKAKDAASICESVFVTLESGKWVKDDSIKTLMLDDMSDTMKLLTYILTKSSLLPDEYSEHKLKLLNTLLDLTKASEIVTFDGNVELSGELIRESFELSKQNKISFQAIYYVLEKLIQKTTMDNIPKPWADFTKTSERIFIRKLYEFLVMGCTLKLYGQYYGILLGNFFKRNFDNLDDKLNFVANFACGHIVCSNDLSNKVGPDLQLRSLKFLKKILDDRKAVTSVFTLQLRVALLLCLTSDHLTIRICATQCMDTMVRATAAKHDPDNALFIALLAKKEEILLDSESISLILYTLLSQQKSVSKVLQPDMQVKMKSALQEILNLICSPETHIHVRSAIVSLLVHINSKEIVEKLAPIGINIFINFKIDEKSNFDIYESTFLRNLYSRIDETVAPYIDDEIIWNLIETSLKDFRPIIYNCEKNLTSACTVMMKQLNANLFKLFPSGKAAEVISLICYAGTYGNHSSIISAAAKLMKRLDIKNEHFTHIINDMLEVKDPAPKKKTRILVDAMLSHRIVETEQWRCGSTLLEYIQNKKNAVLNPTLLPLFFKLLQKCLEFEEQSHVEYTKQLIMSSILGYCENFTKNMKAKDATALKTVFDIELIVKCIRGTQNPQTHHHALMLLSHAATLLPEQVLNHMMAIFTFIGSSVLRHDDAYSFQIIIKIIETIIPILVKLGSHKDRTSVELQKRVIPVLRIFSDVVLDVPEYRRLPLYKKLLETLESKDFLWTFIALLLEAHISHWSEQKDDKIGTSRFLYDRERVAGRHDFAQSLMAEFPLDVVLNNCIKLLTYVTSLPMKKDDNLMEVNEDASVIFSINDHTAFQLRHYKYVVITFLNTCLSSPYFVQLVRTQTNELQVESLYKSFIVKILVYIQSVSKVTDQASSKYWKVMLHHSYDLLDNVNNLLSAPMFISVFRGLMNHTLLAVRRKAMELLNNKIQYDPDMFSECDKSLINSLIPALMETVRTINAEEEDTVDLEVELNQQTALLSLKLLTRLIGGEDPEPLQPLLELITNYTCQRNISGNIMASIVLCLAELCSNLKAHAISSIPKFMPALISILKKQRKADAPELVLLSTVTALWKILENLPHFLSPYLSQILYEYSLLTVKWQKSDQDCAKVSAVVTKLSIIKKKISSAIAPRVLIPVISKCYESHFSKENFEAIGPVMSVLAESFSTLTSADFTTLKQDLTAFFLNALQLRSNLADKTNVTENTINNTEDEVINALVCLVLKLSETSFRPFYFKIYDWAIRTNLDHKDRTITFYRLSSAIAEKLKGLFVLFAGHFVKNAADLLDACNKTKVDELYFDSEEKCILLVENILKTLQIVFLYDSQNFINKEKFETLMQPIVDQFENTLGGIGALQERSKSLLIPCVTQFVVAIADDSLWKPLNYQVLLKTRHNDAEIRLLALDCLVSMATQLGSSWLPLLAESIPFMAELIEDADFRIESATKVAIRQLEQILGEPLQKYF